MRFAKWMVVVLALVLGHAVQAAPFDDALAAYERKDYAAAVRGFRSLAVRGVSVAQFYIGLMYRNGEGVPKDGQQAAYWYRKAAEQGNAAAQNNLGLAHAFGEGVPKDEQQAAYWFRKAAEQGDVDGQFNLGQMYRRGEGVPKDDQQALSWYLKAAEQGDAAAQNALGIMYATGEGVPKDEQQAYFWWLLASAKGEQLATQNRNKVERVLTHEQRASAQAAARNWRSKTAENTQVPRGESIARPPSRIESAASAQADSSGSGFLVARGLVRTFPPTKRKSASRLNFSFAGCAATGYKPG